MNWLGLTGPAQQLRSGFLSTSWNPGVQRFSKVHRLEYLPCQPLIRNSTSHMVLQSPKHTQHLPHLWVPRAGGVPDHSGIWSMLWEFQGRNHEAPIAQCAHVHRYWSFVLHNPSGPPLIVSFSHSLTWPHERQGSIVFKEQDWEPESQDFESWLSHVLVGHYQATSLLSVSEFHHL
jgi:hypothetical protein